MIAAYNILKCQITKLCDDHMVPVKNQQRARLLYTFVPTAEGVVTILSMLKHISKLDFGAMQIVNLKNTQQKPWPE